MIFTTDDKMDVQSNTFYELLDKHLEGIGKQKKDGFCITQERYDKIVTCLNTGDNKKCEYGAKMKHWSRKYYKLEQIGTRNLVYCKKNKQTSSNEGRPICNNRKVPS